MEIDTPAEPAAVTEARPTHEDEVLRPLIIAAAPSVKQSFDQRSGEHKRLDEALDALSAIDLSEPDEAAGASAARTALHVAAVAASPARPRHAPAGAE